MIWLYDRIGYLRKSRQDDPTETVEEVLAKHEAIIQEYCEREFGGRIPPENMYREVISGESIDEREEIKKILAAIENPAIAGVVVVEPSRLSRGDLEDCARVISSFRFSHTLIHTPMMSYDLNNKMERKFFQDELLRGNDYLEYTKEILFRGRVSAVKRGCYINQWAPFGYDKVKIGKDNTLTPNADADAVKLVFEWYANEGLTPLKIARRLTAMGIKPDRSDTWCKASVACMLRNQHYIGKVIFNSVKKTPVMENGTIKKKRVRQTEENVIIAEGKHPAIIDRDLWDKAQARRAANPPVKADRPLRNPLAGIFFCSKCGRAMSIHPYKQSADRFECRSDKQCYKSVKDFELMDGLIYALEKSELPALEAKVKNGDGDARKIQERLLAKLEKQMEEYREQEDTQYELLETKKYTQDVFDRRNGALRIKMEECQAAIYKAKSSMPTDVDYEERLVALKDAIAALRDDSMTPLEKNRLLKVIIDRIEYTGPEKVTQKKGSKNNHTPFTLEIFLKL